MTPTEGVTRSCNDDSFESCGDFVALDDVDLTHYFRVERSADTGSVYVTDVSGMMISCPMASWATATQDSFRVMCRSIEVEEGLRILMDIGIEGQFQSKLILYVTTDPSSCRYAFRHTYDGFIQERFLATCAST